jgi:hypothetical protein
MNSSSRISMKYFSDFYISYRRGIEQGQNARSQSHPAFTLTADIRLECGYGAWRQARSRQTPDGEKRLCAVAASRP